MKTDNLFRCYISLDQATLTFNQSFRSSAQSQSKAEHKLFTAVFTEQPHNSTKQQHSLAGLIEIQNRPWTSQRTCRLAVQPAAASDAARVIKYGGCQTTRWGGARNAMEPSLKGCWNNKGGLDQYQRRHIADGLMNLTKPDTLRGALQGVVVSPRLSHLVCEVNTPTKVCIIGYLLHTFWCKFHHNNLNAINRWQIL